jgi:excinuclease ABC subunit C
MPNRGSSRPKAPLRGVPENPHLPLLQDRVGSTTTSPGIYRWLDEKGTVMYVGKAKNLRKRLSQYVHPSKGASGPWRQSFLAKIADFDVTVTDSEIEALILETNLIKELKPKYNVLMKDDKHYLYVRVTVQDPYPRVETVRRLTDDGAKYFGPIASGDEVRRTLAMLRKLYPFRTCRMEIEPTSKMDSTTVDSGQSDSASLSTDQLSTVHSGPGGATTKIPIEVICRHKDRTTPCLDFHILQCSAPCIGRVTPEEYRKQSIDGVLEFLKGNKEPAKAQIQEKMKQAALDRKFEQAAQLRDHLRTLEGGQESQLASDTTGEDCDVLGVSVLSNRAHVVVLRRRNGRIVGEAHHELAGEAGEETDVLSQFIAQYYEDDPLIPPTILLSVDLPDRDTLEEWLRTKRGAKTTLVAPERGRKSHLVQLAEKNAREKAKLQEIKWESDKANTEAALEGLKHILELPTLPVRIEGYDISHLGGTETVGSMVVMRNGKAANDHYRSFTIRTLKSGDVDDYRSLKEVLSRRLRRFCEDLPMEEKEWNAQGITFGKAKKADQEAIEKIFDVHPNEFRFREINYKHFLVARSGDRIVAFGRLFTTGTITEVKSVWVDKEFRGRKLGQFLVRKLLRTIKKGKVYATIPPELEQYYGELGFRYVVKPAAALQKILDEREKQFGSIASTVMLWESFEHKVDPSLSSKPDLIVIDGGKGQLSAVMEVLEGCKLDIPVIGLAKREEEVFVPDQSDPIPFPRDAQAKFLLMRLRDEAHRFANRHREKRGSKKAFGSALDEIPGIGEKTKGELLKRFGTVAAIRDASDETLREILSEEQLQALRKAL